MWDASITAAVNFEPIRQFYNCLQFELFFLSGKIMTQNQVFSLFCLNWKALPKQFRKIVT